MNIQNKKIIYLLILILSFTSIGVFASDFQHRIDSIKQLVPTTKNDSLLVKHFMTIGWYYGKINNDSAIYYTQKSIDLALKTSDMKGLANGYFVKAMFYYNTENFEISLKTYLSALEIYLNEKDSTKIAGVYNNIGIIYSLGFDKEKAIEYYLKAFKISEGLKDTASIAINLNNIGIIYQDLHSYDKAIDYFLRTLEIDLQVGDAHHIVNSYNNIGDLYLDQKLFKKAFKNLSESYSRIDKIEDVDVKIELLSSFGRFYIETNKADSALIYIREALDLASFAKRKRILAHNYYLIGRYFLLKENYKLAVTHLNEAIKLSDSLHVVEKTGEYYYYVSEAFVKSGDFKKAYFNLQKSNAIKDSLRLDNVRKSLGEYEKQKEFIKIQTEYQLEQIKKESKLENEAVQLKGQFYISIIVIVFLIVLVFVFITNNRNKIKANRQLKNQNEIIENQSKKLKNTINQLQKITVDLDSSNKTKSKLLSIIGHDLRNPFNVIQGYISILTDDKIDPTERQLYYDRIINSSDQLMEMVDNLLLWSNTQSDKIKFNPIPTNITEVANQSIAILQNNANLKKIQIVADYVKDMNLVISVDPDMLTRIIQNLLINAIKFTNEKGQVSLGFNTENSYLKFWVKDNGVGMNPDDAANLFENSTEFVRSGTAGEKGSGLGLSICHDFVKYHGGTIWAESEINKGATFTFTLPIH